MGSKEFDRKAFLVKMIGEFRYKPTEDSIRLTYNNLRRAIERGQKPEDLEILEEKRRILEKCYDMFSNEGFRDIIRRGNFSTKQIAEKSAGIILGDKKRKYNMSDKYLEGSVATIKGEDGILRKDMKYSENQTKIYDYDSAVMGNVKVQQVGVLTYTSGLGVQNNRLKRYKVVIPRKDKTSKEYFVYSDINLDKMNADNEYCSAVLDELLSENNIEYSNSGSYIGVINETRNDSNPLDVGEEREDGKYGDYEYQISNNYKIVYDSQDLSAVIDFEEEKGKNKTNSDEGR